MTANSDYGYRLLPHTADVTLLAWGPTWEACLQQAVRALAAVFVEVRTGSATQTVAVSVPSGPDTEQLLMLLDEALFCIDAHGRVPVGASISRLREGGLTARFDTVAVDDLALIGSVPKAATRHGLAVIRQGSRWQARVTVDV